MANIFIKKNLKQLTEEAGGSQKFQRTLGPFNLTMMGIGAIIGAGIFSLIGKAAAEYAGPGIIFSFVLGGILCSLAGLCYAEMAAMVPVSGSAYAYVYATLGEFIAWMVGWDLVLEYAFGAITVSAAWSGYCISLFSKTLGLPLTDTLLRFTQGPLERVVLSDGSQVFGYWNMPATLIVLVMSSILYKGIRESAAINNLIVFLKVSILLIFIYLGWSVAESANWVANPEALGFSKWVPLQSMVFRNGREVLSFGWPGVLTGAGVVFFAYAGFDAISTTAQECKNPTRDLPIGILLSLMICTILYIFLALVLIGVVPYLSLSVPDPIAVGVDRIVALKGWSPMIQKSFTFCLKFGALLGLTSVILVMMMGQSRIFYAMAKDGLLPWFDRVHERFATPHIATLATGLGVALAAGFLPMSMVGELSSIGTLLAFVLVCVAIPILRITNPTANRPFKTPLYWVIAPAGALSCLWVMSGLPQDTWYRLIAWLSAGVVIYFVYGIKHSHLQQSKVHKNRSVD